jgi:hypothetical protein
MSSFFRRPQQPKAPDFVLAYVANPTNHRWQNGRLHWSLNFAG